MRRAREASYREAVPSAIMSGLTEPFMIPYALALGASTFQAGLLSSVRNLILSLAQLKSADAARWVRSRKALVVQTAGVQALLWLPLAVVGPLFGPWAVPALIAFYTLGTTAGAFGGPAWGSLVGEYLAPEERGRFFGRRAWLTGAWTTVAGLVAGAILQILAERPLVGFGLLCAAAALSRTVSWRMLSQLVEAPWDEPPEVRFSFWKFIRQAATSNFARFSLCMGLSSFGVHFAAPYLAVYMLEELHYGYLTYSVIVLAGSLAGVLAVTRWGRIGDVSGNWVILRSTMLGVSILPLAWPLFPHPAWLLAVHVVGGFLWGGLNLSAVNFVYDAATPAKRARCLAYFNVINGCGVSLGALAGGWLFEHMPSPLGSAFVSLFVCSAALRLLAALAFSRIVHEVRPVRHLGLREVMYDLVGQRVIHVLGFFAAPPESDTSRRP